MKKIVLPKIKLKLFVILMVILGVVVLAEVFVLYKYLYMSLASKHLEQDEAEQPRGARIDLPAYEKMRDWQGGAPIYPGPNYTVGAYVQGRSNPFAEY